MGNAERARLTDQVRRFYQAEHFQLVWLDDKGHPQKRFVQLKNILEHADESGLPRELYPLPPAITDAKDAKNAAPAQDAPETDARITASYFRFFLHLSGGRLDPHALEPLWTLKPPREDLVGDLSAAIDNNTLDQTVHKLEPQHPQYSALKGALADYRQRATQGQHVEAAIHQIELALERWRWLPDPMPDRYLFVNVPDFRLDAIENGKPVLSMRVVVGKPDKQTPIFADKMEYVIFSPYWNVPPDIAKNETAPHAANDPDYLARNNMEVVDSSGQPVDPSSVDWTGNLSGVRVRQKPGAGNALGGVKFVFPNNFDVYLHDTNASKLFDKMERSLSHGCVRVEQPATLAQYVLRDQPEWTADKIAEAMHAGRERRVNLKQPIPVFIVYMTTWVDASGVRFLEDIYHHDAAQSRALGES